MPDPYPGPRPPSRRGWWVLAALLAVCGVLAACGSEGSSDDPAPAATEGAFSVTIEHKYGATEITQAPERVVTVGLSDHDYLLAFGVTPVGVTEWYGEYPSATWPWAQDELGDAKPQVVGDAMALNFEQIAALRPDVIVGLYSGITAEQYSTLSQIAPTVAQDSRFVDYGMPWEEMTRTVGRILGQPERADQLITQTDALFAAARDQHPEFEGRTAVVTFPNTDGTYGVFSPQDPRSRLLTSLGFTIPDEITRMTGDTFFAEISGEQLRLLDHDLLMWYAGGGLGPDLRSQLADNQLFQQLAVAREGRYLVLDDLPGEALAWSTVLSLPFAIDRVVPQIAAAADGDPATQVGPAS